MRRIYESSALDRDDEDPFRPNERDPRTTPRAARSIPAAALSRRLLPRWLRYRAISLSVSTPSAVYQAGETVPFRIEMKNALPFPVEVPTRTPLRWSWHVDGFREASHVPEEPPTESATLSFDRGERKVFRRHWPQTFRVSDSEWEPAPPGEYILGGGIDIERADQYGLADRTTIRIE